MVKDIIRWGLLWQQENQADGKTEHIIVSDVTSIVEGVPIFCTRQEARDYRKRRYGYIRNRPDLREEPFGWRMPKVVRVRISLEE